MSQKEIQVTPSLLRMRKNGPAVRVIAMVNELHRRGYQQLRIFPYEYPLAWRLCIGSRRHFSPHNGAYCEHTADQFPIYSSSQGKDFFGWTGCNAMSARSLSDLFIQAFPEVCAEGMGRDWAYAGWLLELSGRMFSTGERPFVMSEYFDTAPRDLTYLPLREASNGTVVRNFPLPPV